MDRDDHNVGYLSERPVVVAGEPGFSDVTIVTLGARGGIWHAGAGWTGDRYR